MMNYQMYNQPPYKPINQTSLITLSSAMEALSNDVNRKHIGVFLSIGVRPNAFSITIEMGPGDFVLLRNMSTKPVE